MCILAIMEFYLQHSCSALQHYTPLYSTIQHIEHHMIQNYTALYMVTSTIQHYTALYSSIQHYEALYSSIQHYTMIQRVQHYTAYTVPYRAIQHYTALCGTVQRILQYIAFTGLDSVSSALYTELHSVNSTIQHYTALYSVYSIYSIWFYIYFIQAFRV